MVLTENSNQVFSSWLVHQNFKFERKKKDFLTEFLLTCYFDPRLDEQ